MSVSRARDAVATLAWWLDLIGWIPLIPAVVIHEAAHVLVARATGGEVELVRAWPPAFRTEWDGHPTWAIVATQVAPLVLGLAVLPLVVELSLMLRARPFTIEYAAIELYLWASWLAVTCLSPTDLAGVRAAVTGAASES